ncbi:MAG: A/G-specific adenine glycosylase [Desulfobacterales bacterium]
MTILSEKETRDLRRRLVAWYHAHRRPLPWRETTEPYPVWVSEVMLQQTTVKTVLPYYRRFMTRFPALADLARADLHDVLMAWEGLGYYARARNLHRAARIVCDRHESLVPADANAFRRLPGVGDYIAAAVSSIAFDQPHAVVDGNVKRVLARLLLIDIPVNRPDAHKAFKAAAASLLDATQPGAFNQALMELGALICTPRRPACSDCPIKKHCRAERQGQVGEFPKRLRKPPTPLHPVAVGVVFKGRRVLITRRRPDGLLGGLWEFPGGRVRDGETPADACLREIREEVNLTVAIDSHLARIRHADTHFKIVMDVYRCRYVSGQVTLNGPTDHRWVELDELAGFPFPKANLKFMPLLKPPAPGTV